MRSISCAGVKAFDRHLRLDLRVALLDQRGSGAFELVGRRCARQRAAGIGRHWSRKPPSSRASGMPKALPRMSHSAMSIAEMAKSAMPPGAARRRSSAQLGGHLLGAQRVVAVDQVAKFLDRRLQRAHDLAAERGDADTLDAVVGLHLHGEEFAQHAGHDGAPTRGSSSGRRTKLILTLLNFHFCLRSSVDAQFFQTASGPARYPGRDLAETAR